MAKKHGLKQTPEYTSWRAMRNRCMQEKNSHYSSYGGRGIKVCDRWNDFLKFREDMGPRPSEHTLDRIDVDGDYEPSNCRWSNTKIQSRNTKRTKAITWNGVTKCLKDWALELGIEDAALRYRLKNWDLERAMTEPALNARHLHKLKM